MASVQVGNKVRIVDAMAFGRCQWWPQGEVTGNVQKLFKNGKVAVAVHQLRNINDSGDGLTTLHFVKAQLEVIG